MEKERQELEKKRREMEKMLKEQNIPLVWPTLKRMGVFRTPGGRHVAILDRIGDAETGDVVEMEYNGVIYRWKINAVTEKEFSYTRMDARRIATPSSPIESKDAK